MFNPLSCKQLHRAQPAELWHGIIGKDDVWQILQLSEKGRFRFHAFPFRFKPARRNSATTKSASLGESSTIKIVSGVVMFRTDHHGPNQVLKTGEKDSTFDEMRVQLKPQLISNGKPNGSRRQSLARFSPLSTLKFCEACPRAQDRETRPGIQFPGPVCGDALRPTGIPDSSMPITHPHYVTTARTAPLLSR